MGTEFTPVRPRVDDTDALVAALRESITQSGLSLTQVAFHTGVTEGAIRSILSRSTTAPSAVTLLRLMALLPGFAERLGFEVRPHAA